MDLKQCLEAVNYKIGEVSQFLWDSLGLNTRIWAFENKNGGEIGSFIANNSGDVLSVEVLYIDKNGNDKCYRWIDADLKEAYFAEGKSKCINMDIFLDNTDYVDLETQEDMLEKMAAICKEEEFDQRIEVPLNLSDEDFLAVAKIAHSKDITFNAQVILVLEDVIKNSKKYQEQKVQIDKEEALKFSNKVGKIERSQPFILTVQEDSEGELFLQFTDDMLKKIGWEIGDTLSWKDNQDGSFSIEKK